MVVLERQIAVAYDLLEIVELTDGNRGRRLSCGSLLLRGSIALLGCGITAAVAVVIGRVIVIA